MKNRVKLYFAGVIIAGVLLSLPAWLAAPTADAHVPLTLPTRTAPTPTEGGGNGDGHEDESVGALVGYVWDIFDKANMPNMVVKVDGKEAVTDSDGFFAFNDLPVGTYDVALQLPAGGLPEYSSAAVEIVEDEILRLDLSFASQPLPEPTSEVLAASASQAGDSQSSVIPARAIGSGKSIVIPISLAPRKATAPTNSALEACADSPISVYTGKNPTMAISPPLVNHETGQEGCVKIDVSDMVDMGAFQGELHFDPDMIEIKSVTLGDFLGQVNRQVTLATELDEKAGIVYLGAFSIGKAGAPNGGGTLVTVKFNTKGEGRSEVKLVNMLSADHIGNDNVQGQLDISNGIIRSTACFGDLNADESINVNDIQAVAGRVDQPSLYQEQYDFNADGVIDDEDINIIIERWNQICK